MLILFLQIRTYCKRVCFSYVICSVAQMARFYLHLSEHMPMYSERVLATLKSQPSIFLPRIVGSIREEVVDGAFFSLQNLCWSDPTGILSTMLVLEKSSQKPTLSSCLSKAQDIKQKDYRKVLNAFYPELQNFFVNQCSVQERPGFYGYIGILQRVAAFTSPSSCLDQVGIINPSIFSQLLTVLAFLLGLHKGNLS